MNRVRFTCIKKFLTKVKSIHGLMAIYGFLKLLLLENEYIIIHFGETEKFRKWAHIILHLLDAVIVFTHDELYNTYYQF